MLTAPFWWPYGYASPSYYPYYPYSYSYPYYEPYPVYSYPAPVPGSAPPAAAPATPTTPTPPLAPPAGGQGPTPPAAGEGATARRCDAVWVEGHYETHVGPSGQASTFWIPGATRQICQ